MAEAAFAALPAAASAFLSDLLPLRKNDLVERAKAANANSVGTKEKVMKAIGEAQGFTFSSLAMAGALPRAKRTKLLQVAMAGDCALEQYLEVNYFSKAKTC